MGKDKKYKKLERRRLAQIRYSAKRRTKKWKNRKKARKIDHQRQVQKVRKQAKKPYTKLPAPKSFSLIANTNEVLKYFDDAEKRLRGGENITFDITNVSTLTPDTIALMVASVNDSDFYHEGNLSGNVPQKSDLAKLFNESGFHEHVSTRGYFVTNKNNLLHKEMNKKVVSSIAKDASLTGIRHVFGNEKPFEPLYEILIECMSNTNNHAVLHHRGKCNWWLYAYSEPNEKVTSYSFLDLGVGIFKSAVVQEKLKNLFKGTVFYGNIKLVDDLLAGRLQSRVDEDKEIRGKGIPQIVEHSKSDNFKSFYIITNDVKMNLKTGERVQLSYSLNGTFLYWELQNK